jgi:hypothetical protein
MTITEKLRLEVLMREQLARHGDDFYVDLAQILNKLSSELHNDQTTQKKMFTDK